MSFAVKEASTPTIEEAFNKLADLFSDYDLHNQPVMKMQTLEALATIDQNAREEERERIYKAIADMRPIMWHKHPERHRKNIEKYNIIDEILQSISNPTTK